MFILTKGPRAGFNPKTGAQPQMNSSRSRSANDYSRQAEQFVRQSPEPFRNPSASPLSNPGSVAHKGIPYGETSKPGKHPTRSIGSNPPSDSTINTDSGHSPNYKPAGYYPAISGHARQGMKSRNNNSNAGRQPQAVKPAYKGQTSNFDLYNEETMKDFKRL